MGARGRNSVDMPWAVEECGCDIMVTIGTAHCEVSLGVIRSGSPKKVTEVTRSQWTLKSVRVPSFVFIPELHFFAGYIIHLNIQIDSAMKTHLHPNRPRLNPIPSPPDLIALELIPPLIFNGVFLPCSLPDHDDIL